MTSALLLAGCGAGPRPETPRAGGVAAASAVPAAFPASDVLRAWDEARSHAFAQGDVTALRRLYVPGSTAGTSDVRLLRAYARRGLRVEEMRMQVLSLEVQRHERRRPVLLVTDRLAGAVAVGEGGRTALPRDRASTRVVELRRNRRGAPWRVATVTGSSRRPAAR
jgi:hypothetical protein